MKLKANNKNLRIKLIATFWLAAREAGIKKEFADSFVLSCRFSNGKSLSKLTVDELQSVVSEFLKVCNVNVKMPTQTSRRNPKERPSRIEIASSGQLKKIDDLAAELDMPDYAVVALLERCGHLISNQISKTTAQKTIEALKAMKERGWKPNKPASSQKNDDDIIWN